ncbi:mitochondrial adenyl nucleotide antiporter SLC25A24-B-like isoform X2 [Tachypleus tridentatus]|uniref:mitochondrial adenyl nucleotide antiporter SLC25A24-B-like isoform X2 n=1 Tax=Tachypleus tridentatus TaxID=6853 RepID=UPI003FD19F78
MNVPNSHHLPHYFQELPSEREERLEKLFKQLDVDGDGRINFEDLSEALQKMGLPHAPDSVEKFIEKSDLAKSGNVDFAEFAHYVMEHEKQLLLVFKSLDENSDGSIDTSEIVNAFKKLGIYMSYDDAFKLLQRMDKDGSLTITFDEWRDYLLFHPSSELADIFKYWRHATFLDIGEDTLVPDDFTEQEMRTGMWWRHLVAGGLAGAVSRTSTAPLDRLKVFLQVRGREFTSVQACFMHMLQEGGVRSLWRGNGINVLKIAPESALKFMAYEQVLKTRLALGKTGQYYGLWDAAKKLYYKEGLRCFYRGYLPNLLGILPYAGIDLAIYETLKNIYISHHPREEYPGIFVLLGCGTISSSCGQVASYPLALVELDFKHKRTRRKIAWSVSSEAFFIEKG